MLVNVDGNKISVEARFRAADDPMEFAGMVTVEVNLPKTGEESLASVAAEASPRMIAALERALAILKRDGLTY